MEKRHERSNQLLDNPLYKLDLYFLVCEQATSADAKRVFKFEEDQDLSPFGSRSNEQPAEQPKCTDFALRFRD